MRQPLFILKLLFSLILFGLSATVFAQSDPVVKADPVVRDSSYDVMLHVLAGSNDTSQKGELPQGFAQITRQLKGTFGYTNFRVVNTYIGRLGNNGTIQYQSIANNFGADPLERPVFLDWQLQGLRSIAATGGPNGFQIQGFHFGAKIPIRTSSGLDANGKAVSVFNYESIGLNVNRMSINQGQPVLIGTMELPQTTGTMFLVLSVNPVEN
jgi:hypothetical protein